MKVYEVYNLQGIPTAIEHGGPISAVVNLIGSSEILFGVDRRTGLPEAIYVRRGENVSSVCECGPEEWEKVFKPTP